MNANHWNSVQDPTIALSPNARLIPCSPISRENVNQNRENNWIKVASHAYLARENPIVSRCKIECACTFYQRSWEISFPEISAPGKNSRLTHFTKTRSALIPLFIKGLRHPKAQSQRISFIKSETCPVMKTAMKSRKSRNFLFSEFAQLWQNKTLVTR